jgi:hypothetical protein
VLSLRPDCLATCICDCSVNPWIYSESRLVGLCFVHVASICPFQFSHEILYWRAQCAFGNDPGGCRIKKPSLNLDKHQVPC